MKAIARRATSAGARACQKQQFRVISALVSCRRDELCEVALLELRRMRAIVSYMPPSSQPFPADSDLIVVDFDEGLTDRLPWMPGEATSALLVLLPQNEIYDRRKVIDCTPDAVLGQPFTAALFRTTVEVALSLHSYTARLRGRIARLDENLRAGREIERAKSILMAKRAMDEKAAYAFIRSQAMERRTTVAAVASVIVDNEGVLG